MAMNSIAPDALTSIALTRVEKIQVIGKGAAVTGTAPLNGRMQELEVPKIKIQKAFLHLGKHEKNIRKTSLFINPQNAHIMWELLEMGK